VFPGGGGTGIGSALFDSPAGDGTGKVDIAAPVIPNGTPAKGGGTSNPENGQGRKIQRHLRRRAARAQARAARMNRLQQQVALHRCAHCITARGLAIDRDQGKTVALATLARRGHTQELEARTQWRRRGRLRAADRCHGRGTEKPGQITPR
jgi:hypothetical protein